MMPALLKENVKEMRTHPGKKPKLARPGRAGTLPGRAADLV